MVGKNGAKYSYQMVVFLMVIYIPWDRIHKKSPTKQIQDYQDTGWLIGTLVVAYETLPIFYHSLVKITKKNKKSKSHVWQRHSSDGSDILH